MNGRSRIHPDDIQPAKLAIEHYLSGEREAYGPNSDSCVRMATTCGFRPKGKIVSRDEKGNTTRFVGTHSDITEQVRAENEIRRRAGELAALLNSSQSLAATLNLEIVLQTTTDSITELMELQSAAIYLLEGETLCLGATSPALPPQFPEEFRRAPLADHPHIREVITTGLPIFLPTQRPPISRQRNEP